ncbi:MAG: Na(+)/H(+) antiporter subunit B [Planctomycetota bacterium]|nr:MAG: Na(+)/H(+) antiporter subunit B [Planctomycetota bacterium]
MKYAGGSSGSIILGAVARILMPLLIMASIFILLRGHNEPGGGFIGGLLGGVAFVLTAVAFGPLAARRALGISPYSLIGWGLGFAILGALIPLLLDQIFFSPAWTSFMFFGQEVKVGTPLVFDIGVYLLVLGIAVVFVLSLMEVDFDDHDPEGMDSDHPCMADDPPPETGKEGSP